MCDECHQSTHATMCPNGAPMVDVIYVDCALCGAEVDEETTTYGICEKCWTDARTFDNALTYGATNQLSVKINGLFAKLMTPEQIYAALRTALNETHYSKVVQAVDEFLSDDYGDFADWLKEQKGKE